ncbi:MAG: PQ-loop domain-containing transporter [Patescibacteria group bacterium]|nr:PQ-loop domain-containing transporter [Patescibacteria group bacterium]
MKREEFATRFHWSKMVWLGGIMNVAAMLPQLISLIKTKETAGLSIAMFYIFLVVQIIFATQGYFTRSKAQLITMVLSAMESILIIILISSYS